MAQPKPPSKRADFFLHCQQFSTNVGATSSPLRKKQVTTGRAILRILIRNLSNTALHESDNPSLQPNLAPSFRDQSVPHTARHYLESTARCTRVSFWSCFDGTLSAALKRKTRWTPQILVFPVWQQAHFFRPCCSSEAELHARSAQAKPELVHSLAELPAHALPTRIAPEKTGWKSRALFLLARGKRGSWAC